MTVFIDLGLDVVLFIFKPLCMTLEVFGLTASFLEFPKIEGASILIVEKYLFSFDLISYVW